MIKLGNHSNLYTRFNHRNLPNDDLFFYSVIINQRSVDGIECQLFQLPFEYIAVCDRKCTNLESLLIHLNGDAGSLGWEARSASFTRYQPSVSALNGAERRLRCQNFRLKLHVKHPFRQEHQQLVVSVYPTITTTLHRPEASAVMKSRAQ